MFKLLISNPLKSIWSDIKNTFSLSTDWITPTAGAIDNTIRGYPIGIGARTIWIDEIDRWRPLEIMALLVRNSISSWGLSNWNGYYSIEVSEDDYQIAIQILDQEKINFR